MIEVQGDLFEYPCDALCLTTNGFVKKDRTAVMGRGVALQATRHWPDIARNLACALRRDGLHVGVIQDAGETVVLAFPVKYNWWERANLELIARSARELVALTNKMRWRSVILPRPGCGNGQLAWAVVRAVLEGTLLGDRFCIVDTEAPIP